jgi:hypothetical protein
MGGTLQPIRYDLLTKRTCPGMLCQVQTQISCQFFCHRGL